MTPAIVGAPLGQEGPAGGGVRIQADVANNSLVIFADAEMTERILKALERIDVPQLQVAINVTMAEIRLTDELRYGIQFFLKSHTFGLGDDKARPPCSADSPPPSARPRPGFNFVLGSTASPDVIISAFDGITDVQVLSSPSLVVVENETAKFQVGDQIPIVTRSVTSVQDPEAPVSNEVEYRDTGIILNIKPRIAENGVVSLEIGQEISSVAAGGNTLTPTISNRADQELDLGGRWPDGAARRPHQRGGQPRARRHSRASAACAASVACSGAGAIPTTAPSSSS